MSFESDDSEVGFFPQCGLRGPSFLQCPRCGEDTGMLFVPRTNSDIDAEDSKENENETDETNNETSEYSSEDEEEPDIWAHIESRLRLLQ